MTRRSIVVGGSKGIGRTLARSWVAAGHDVIILSRSEPEGVDGLRHLPVDLEDSAAVDATASALAAEGFDDLVFVQRYRGDDPWGGELAITLDATRLVTERLVDAQPPGRPGSIVFVTSLAASLVVPDQAAGYHAAKAGMDALMRYYAHRYGPKQVRVNAVAPGLVLKEEAEAYFAANPGVLRDRTSATPLGRMPTAGEIAGLVAFLCSEAAAIVTGHVLVADGGLSLTFQAALRPPA